ncbi:MAG TPA: hypothetical protein VGI29_03045, partial [Candidatus Binataceae bacterium]
AGTRCSGTNRPHICARSQSRVVPFVRGPGKNFTAGAAAQHEEIAFFHGFLPFYEFLPGISILNLASDSYGVPGTAQTEF